MDSLNFKFDLATSWTIQTTVLSSVYLRRKIMNCASRSFYVKLSVSARLFKFSSHDYSVSSNVLIPQCPIFEGYSTPCRDRTRQADMQPLLIFTSHCCCLEWGRRKTTAVETIGKKSNSPQSISAGRLHQAVETISNNTNTITTAHLAHFEASRTPVVN